MSNALGNFVMALAGETLADANRKIERLAKERDDARRELAELRARASSNAATAAPGDLPPLPEPFGTMLEHDADGFFSGAQMREYGRACIASNAGAAPADAESELLDILGRDHPYAQPYYGAEFKQRAYERLRRAIDRQQPSPVPDQAAIVWRADLMAMEDDLTHKQSFFDRYRDAPSINPPVGAKEKEL